MAIQLARSGATRVRQGETPELKRATNLTKLQAQQNIDYLEDGFRELQARDNADGPVSMHIFSAGPDQDPAPGKVRVGNLEAEIEGTTRSGTRYSVEDRGDVQKYKSYRFEDSKVVVFEATVKPGNEVNTSVLILDRDNPERSQIGSTTSEWLLSL
ncbi:MAG: hypothetical protein U0931_11450 [Vulcanimicrobiota bacterium]